MSPHGGARIDRVQKLAKQILGELIQDLKDPRVGFATVTAVKVSPDLRHARVFVSVFGTSDEQELTMRGLHSATPFLRTELGRQMRTKYLPELDFQLDTGPEDAQRLESLLHRLDEEKSHDDTDSRLQVPNENEDDA
ncbi:MAG: 30S ribosome-binding factor RbfA [Actinomycetota bacterium]|nr:30S ribosome-binding factor RbfA [Actinomycetota bacterium]